MSQQPPAVPHTLFLRNDCRYCALIQSEIDAADMRGAFQFVDVDSQPIDHSRITVVPTILADHQQLLQGRDAFAWVNNKKTNMIHGAPQSSGKGGWDSMSCNFTFIDEAASDLGRTNTGMSCVYSTIGGAVPAGQSAGTGGTGGAGSGERGSGRGKGVDDAMERMMAQRQAEHAPATRQGGVV